MKKIVIILAIIFVALLGAVIVLHLNSQQPAPTQPTQTQDTTPPTTPAETTLPAETEPVETEPAETEPTETEPEAEPFTAIRTENSDPANWNFQWDIIVGDQIVESYEQAAEISFEDDNYFSLPGVASFRGNNYRNEAGYGTADITEGKINLVWTKPVGYLHTFRWNGCAWTGQPLVVQWDEQTKQHMNLYEDKKNKEGLVEVIYAKMDGRVHFFDMEDGSPTRDPMYVGMIFKGSGALDPRGYPILYVGAGIAEDNLNQAMYIINLIDCTILKRIDATDLLTNRYWFALDASPLVDAETDTLLWPCESGMFFTFDLNSQYDPATGALTVDPQEVVKTRYTDDYHNQGRYLGYEASPTIVDHYAYLADNGGMLQCVDLNTMELVWTQDIVDDLNASPVFDWGDDGNGYLYVAPSMDYSGNRKENDLPICKVDARTGEIVWKYEVRCGTVDGISGGALATPLLGRKGTEIEDLIIFAMGRTPETWSGMMIAFDKETGEVVWEYETNYYMWSSPIAVYDEEGNAFVFLADQKGGCYLLDGKTGELLDYVKYNTTFEASPVAFGDRIFLGSRYEMYLFQVK